MVIREPRDTYDYVRKKNLNTCNDYIDKKNISDKVKRKVRLWIEFRPIEFSSFKDPFNTIDLQMFL